MEEDVEMVVIHVGVFFWCWCLLLVRGGKGKRLLRHKKVVVLTIVVVFLLVSSLLCIVCVCIVCK